MSVANFSVPYSWFNITEKLGNNQIGYVWFDAASSNAGDPTSPYTTGQRFFITIPDGFYDLSTLNSFLQFNMIQNGHYMIDTQGRYVYFLQLINNVTSYRVQVNSYTVPQSQPGYISVVGSGVHFTGPNVGLWPTPKLMVIDKNTGNTNMFVYFGFSEPTPVLSGSPPLPVYPNIRYVPLADRPSGTYMSTSVLAELSPMETTVHSICLTCNMIDNPIRSTALHPVSTFVVTTQNIGVPFGTDISNSNFFTTWIPLLGGQTIQSLKFQLLDQEGSSVVLQDPDTNIELLITDLRY